MSNKLTGSRYLVNDEVVWPTKKEQTKMTHKKILELLSEQITCLEKLKTKVKKLKIMDDKPHIEITDEQGIGYFKYKALEKKLSESIPISELKKLIKKIQGHLNKEEEFCEDMVGDFKEYGSVRVKLIRAFIKELQELIDIEELKDE